MPGHRCPDDKPCDACCAHQLRAAGPQADAIGQCWAEHVCRGELRARPAWPEHEPKTLAIARRKVGALARDPRLVDALAAVCSAGAAGDGDRRPATGDRT